MFKLYRNSSLDSEKRSREVIELKIKMFKIICLS